MYKFLMVDDEDIIRAGVKGRIDWQGLGYEFLEPCADGREAMARIAEYRPDVVMTDICMPFVDGIELSSHIATHYPGTAVIVLSGYEDFEYARASIRNKVFDYILKPITAQELTGLLVRVSAKLDQDRAAADADARIRKEFSRGREMARETLLKKIFSGAVSDPDEGFLAETLGTDPDGLYFVSSRLSMAAPGSVQTPSLPDRFVSWINAILNPSGIGGMRDSLYMIELCGSEKTTVTLSLLFYDRSEDRTRKLAEFLSRRLAECFVREGFATSAGIGRCYRGVQSVAASTAEAGIALEYGPVYGDGLYRYDPVREEGSALSYEDEHFIDRLRAAIRAGAGDEMREIVKSLSPQLRRSKAPVRKLRADVQAVFSAVADLSLHLGEPAGNDEILARYYHIGDHVKGIVDIESALLCLCEHALSLVLRGGAGSAERKIYEFREYVSRNYPDRDLSIAKVSRSLNLSPSYLSKMIKRHLDSSFVEYLTGYRMDRAKEMLAGSNRMTYEIAEAAGYPDARYFSSTFKRMTGITPSQYRENRRK